MVAAVNYVHMNRCCHGCIASHRIASNRYTHFLSRNMRRFNIYSPSPIPWASIFSATQLKIWFNLMIPLPLPYSVYTIHNSRFLLHLDNTGELDVLGCAKIFRISRADFSVSFPIHTTNVLQKFFENGFQQQTNRLLTQLCHLMLKCVFG